MADPALIPAVIGSAPVPVRKSILIVEDNPLNMKLFSAMIGAQGYDVLQAADAISQFLELIETFMLQVPDISGFAPE
jgi:CheY-like chemotaxis protein